MIGKPAQYSSHSNRLFRFRSAFRRVPAHLEGVVTGTSTLCGTFASKSHWSGTSRTIGLSRCLCGSVPHRLRLAFMEGSVPTPSHDVDSTLNDALIELFTHCVEPSSYLSHPVPVRQTKGGKVHHTGSGLRCGCPFSTWLPLKARFTPADARGRNVEYVLAAVLRANGPAPVTIRTFSKAP